MSDIWAEKEEKTKAEIKEIARAKVYNVRIRGMDFVWIDLRSEFTKVGVSLKNIGGQYGQKGKFDQLVLVSDQYFQRKAPNEIWKKLEKINAAVTEFSGSNKIGIVTSTLNPMGLPRCKNCGAPLFLTGDPFKCQRCGVPAPNIMIRP
jgi:exosome complex RNA-binding protein Csl4